MTNDLFFESRERLKKYCRKMPFGEEVSSIDFINRNPRFYLYYPYLFSDAFKYYDLKILNKLAIAGFLLYKSIIIKDQLLDDIYNKKLDGQHKKFIEIKESCQEEAMKILADLFDSKSNFWKFFRKRKMELLGQQSIENELNQKFNFNKYKTLADNKSAFGKLAIDALFVLTKEKEKIIYRKLLNSHKYFSIGFQLLDDSTDITIDLENNQFNFCSYLMKNETIRPADIQKTFFLKDYAFQTYNKSYFYFAKSIEVLKTLDSEKWISEIHPFKVDIDLRKINLISYKEELIKRFEVKKQRSSVPFIFSRKTSQTIEFDNLLYSILDYISRESHFDFYEAKHIMYLSPKEGFKGRDTVYVGDVFQKAIIWDVLSELNYKFDLNLLKSINDGIDDIISKRRKTNIGGWSYFPRAIENAADADTLGQILQLLVHNGSESLIPKYCSKAINILLTDNALPDGGIKTWIIPKVNLTKAEKIQLDFNKTKWGSGPNADVVANFIFGLYLFNEKTHSKQILNSCNYLVSQQDGKGFWDSRWYFREFYGTYVCARILACYKSLFNESLNKANDFIESSQNNDGGWGTDIISNPLDTSFALLSLGFINKDSPMIRKGLKYLIANKNNDNSWDAVDFIKPRSIEPYKSAVITTIFALKVLMTFQSLIKEEYLWITQK